MDNFFAVEKMKCKMCVFSIEATTNAKILKYRKEKWSCI